MCTYYAEITLFYFVLKAVLCVLEVHAVHPLKKVKNVVQLLQNIRSTI